MPRPAFVYQGLYEGGHAQKISDMTPDHNDATLNRFSHPFFTDEFGANLFAETQELGSFQMKPNVSVSKKQLFEAIAAITEVANVIDGRIYSQEP